jgi:hypothetical protein
MSDGLQIVGRWPPGATQHLSNAFCCLRLHLHRGQQNRLGGRTNTGDDRWRWCAFAQDVMGGSAGKCNNQPPLSTSIQLVIETMGSRRDERRRGCDNQLGRRWTRKKRRRRWTTQQLLWAEAAQSHRRLITQQSTPKARALDSEVPNDTQHKTIKSEEENWSSRYVCSCFADNEYLTRN